MHGNMRPFSKPAFVKHRTPLGKLLYICRTHKLFAIGYSYRMLPSFPQPHFDSNANSVTDTEPALSKHMRRGEFTIQYMCSHSNNPTIQCGVQIYNTGLWSPVELRKFGLNPSISVF